MLKMWNWKDIGKYLISVDGERLSEFKSIGRKRLIDLTHVRNAINEIKGQIRTGRFLQQILLKANSLNLFKKTHLIEIDTRSTKPVGPYPLILCSLSHTRFPSTLLYLSEWMAPSLTAQSGNSSYTVAQDIFLR